VALRFSLRCPNCKCTSTFSQPQRSLITAATSNLKLPNCEWFARTELVFGSHTWQKSTLLKIYFLDFLSPSHRKPEWYPNSAMAVSFQILPNSASNPTFDTTQFQTLRNRKIIQRKMHFCLVYTASFNNWKLK
jgi:hypothetical protein